MKIENGEIVREERDTTDDLWAFLAQEFASERSKHAPPGYGICLVLDILCHRGIISASEMIQMKHALHSSLLAPKRLPHGYWLIDRWSDRSRAFRSMVCAFMAVIPPEENRVQ